MSVEGWWVLIGALSMVVLVVDGVRRDRCVRRMERRIEALEDQAVRVSELAMVKQELRGVTAQLTAAVCDGMTWHRASQLLMQHSKRLAVLEDERLPPQWEEVHPVGGCAACTPVADENWSA